MLSPLRATWGHSTSDYHCSLTTTFPIIHCPIIPDYHFHLCLIILFSSPHGQVHKSHQQKPQLIGYLDWGRRDKLLDPCWRSLLLWTAPRLGDEDPNAALFKHSHTGRVENQQTGQLRINSGNPRNRQRSGQAAIIRIKNNPKSKKQKTNTENAQKCRHTVQQDLSKWTNMV